MTTRKTRKSVGTPQRSRIPRFMYDFKRSRTGMSQSSKKVSSPSGSFKKMAAVSSVRKVLLKVEKCHQTHISKFDLCTDLYTRG